MKLATATLNDGQHPLQSRRSPAVASRPNFIQQASLARSPRMIEGTQLGSIQLFIAPPEFFVGVDQRFELLSAAGLAESHQHAIRIISDPEFAKASLAIGTNKGLIGRQRLRRARRSAHSPISKVRRSECSLL
jgi:TRAP-type transport system periplasmic protein